MTIREIKENISYIIEDLGNLPYKIKKIFLKIYKILQYIPILWRDEDWDFEYMLILLKYKLRRISECLKEENIIEEKELNKIGQSIQKTLVHIENYQNSDKEYEKRFGEFPIHIKHILVKSPDEKEIYRTISINAETGEELSEEEEKALIDFISKKNEFEQQEWKNIFDTIKEYGQSWWS